MAYGKGDGEGERSFFDSLLGRGGGDAASAGDGSPVDVGDDADDVDDDGEDCDGAPVERETEFAGNDGRPEEWDEGGGHWWETITDVWRESALPSGRDDDDDAVAIADDEDADDGGGDAPAPAGDDAGDADGAADAADADGNSPADAADAGDGADESQDGDGEPVDVGDPDGTGASGASDESGESAAPPQDDRGGSSPAGHGEPPSPRRAPETRSRRGQPPAPEARRTPSPDRRVRPAGPAPGQRPRMSPEPVSSSGAVRDATHSFGSRADDVLLPNARRPVPAGASRASDGPRGIGVRRVVAVAAAAVLAGFAIGVVSHVELPTDKVSVELGNPVASASVGEEALDADAATLSYAGKAIRVSLRQAIEAGRPLSEARLDDGSYAAPSAEDVLAAVRGEVILADAAARGIAEEDAVSSWVSSRYGLASVADLAREMGVPEEEAFRQVRGPAVAQALMEKAVGAGFAAPPAAPYEPASGNKSERVARYATYVNNLDDVDKGVADAALGGYAYDGSVASYDMAVATYEEALSRWEERQSRLEARWDEYLNALLSAADVHIRTCSVAAVDEGDSGKAPDASSSRAAS